MAEFNRLTLSLSHVQGISIRVSPPLLKQQGIPVPSSSLTPHSGQTSGDLWCDQNTPSIRFKIVCRPSYDENQDKGGIFFQRTSSQL